MVLVVVVVVVVVEEKITRGIEPCTLKGKTNVPAKLIAVLRHLPTGLMACRVLV